MSTMEMFIPITLSALGWLFGFFLNLSLLYRKKDDRYYRERKTVIFFALLFFFSFLQDAIFIMHAFNVVGMTIYKGALIVKSLILVASFSAYVSDLKFWSAKKIPEEEHDKKIEEIHNKVLADFEGIRLSDQTRRIIDNRFKELKDARQ
ncbi:hypothetical protein INR75_06600 [Zunongwangia sp. SCSIO 43204]|uniref:hypothetical protein n=1 Tax=Zunongwangia sp. SCSIO 43204 TaxID=2779359 RepID=UPI001CA7E1BB|nr:hypothetical protein [Zunongwangia sp. SCSIO 43204]UAB85678.1 hypothetical protein INR75_06600 [Zunongwangia sp. SCSIO 43204]